MAMRSLNLMAMHELPDSMNGIITQAAAFPEDLADVRLDVTAMPAVLLPPVTKKQQRIQKVVLAEMEARPAQCN